SLGISSFQNEESMSDYVLSLLKKGAPPPEGGWRCVSRTAVQVCDGLGPLLGGGRVGDDDHRVADHPVPDAVTAAEDGAQGLVLTGGQVLDGLVDLRVEGLPLLAEGGELQAGDRVGELVGEGPERALLEVTVLAGQLQVVEDR